MISPYYINLLGRYGSRHNDYPTMAALLHHMDRLGIWQTTATCPLGNVVDSNKALLRDIEQTPGAKERVIPAFLAEPHIYISKGEMEHLRMCLEKYRPSCMRLQPKRSQFRLREMEQVLIRLEDLNPVILVDKLDMEDSMDIDDMIFLANRFPDMRFVIQRVMWGRLHFIFDAMQRAENIYMDTGWMHIEGGHLTMCEQFGMERMVFSLAIPSNQGAPIAALSYADIPQQWKDAIASDNFINLFSNPEDREVLRQRRRKVENKVANSYWNRFVEHKPLGIPVIDAHTHVSPHLMQWFSRNNIIEEEAEILQKQMDRQGICMSIISHPGKWHDDVNKPNGDLLRVTEPYRDTMKGYLFYMPDLMEGYTEEYMDKMFQTGFFIGLKALPKYVPIPVHHENFKPMFRYAQKHKLPILFHTWEDAYGTAKMTGDVAKQWPEVPVIIGHSGGGDKGRQECHEMAQDPKYDNLYFDFCGSHTSKYSWQESLKYIDYHRVLFGTDTNLHDAAWEIGRLLSEDIPDEQLKEILGGNAIRLFGLEVKQNN